MRRNHVVTSAVALTFLLSFAVHAGPSKEGSLIGDEQKIFVDAPEKFPKFILPSLKPMGGALWLDNDHLIMSVNELPNGWRAEKALPVSMPLSPVETLPPDVSRIIVVDANKGTIADAPYAGQMVCADNRNIVISLTKPDGHDRNYYAGPYGTRLSLLDVPNGRTPTFGSGCDLASLPDEFWNYPLRPGDGILHVHRTSSFQVDVTLPSVLMDSSGQVRKRFEAPADMLPPGIRYLPYLNQYVIEKYDAPNRKRAGALMTTDGDLSPIEPDPILHGLILSEGGTARVFYTRRGSLWSFQPSPRLWREQGLYLRDGDDLLRLESKSVLGARVSPNGCRILYWRVSGDPNQVLGSPQEWKSFQVIVMTICKP